MITITFTEHQIEEETAIVLVQRIETVIANKGKCVLALSGGKSPEGLYKILAERLPAKGVDIVLVDERIVPRSSDYSNGSFVKNCFVDSELQSKVHLYETEGDDYYEQSQVLLDRFPDIDLAVLGLGEDGHTASLFKLEDLELDERLIKISKKGEGFDRISLSYGELLRVPQILFYVKDSEKEAIIEKLNDPERALKYPAGKLLWEHQDASIISQE